MAYEVYLDEMLLPVPPEKIPIKYTGQNKKITLISGEEVNLIRPPGLAEISLDFVLPQMDYPAAIWNGSVEDAEAFLDRLKEMKAGRRPFEFTVVRDGSWNVDSFDTCMDVTMEDYKVSDDVKEGVDLTVSVSLKEYRNYGTKIMDFSVKEDETVSGAAETQRQGEPEQGKTYTVVKGDCLWKIAKKHLGDGSRWCRAISPGKPAAPGSRESVPFP